MRRQGSKPVPRRRYATSVLVAMLAAAVVVPAVTAGKTPAVPNCAHLSRAGMEKIVATGTLHLKSQTGNLCAFEGEITGHYRPVLDVQVVPGTASLFASVESTAKATAAKQHATFGTVSKKLKLGTAAFFVTSTDTGDSLPPCKPGEKPPKLGGPRCKGEPAYTKIEVISWGPSKPKSLVLMVSTAIGVQQGDAHLSDIIALNKAILTRVVR